MAWIKKFTASSSQDITFWTLLGINRDQNRIKIEELLISSEKSNEGYICFFKNSCFGPSNLTLFLLSFCYERCLLIIPFTLVFFSALFYRKFAYFQNKIVKKLDLGILRTPMLLPHFFWILISDYFSIYLSDANLLAKSYMKLRASIHFCQIKGRNFDLTYNLETANLTQI